ncbi:hypothetical protein [Halobacteriovorax sp. ZH2_bin.1]|uniref:hypothetical protein n=1 Tax=unclassified Halobacteriovorax TaxID=2639665 RepID=UPI00371F6A47
MKSNLFFILTIGLASCGIIKEDVQNNTNAGLDQVIKKASGKTPYLEREGVIKKNGEVFLALVPPSKKISIEFDVLYNKISENNENSELRELSYETQSCYKHDPLNQSQRSWCVAEYERNYGNPNYNPPSYCNESISTECQWTNCDSKWPIKHKSESLEISFNDQFNLLVNGEKHIPGFVSNRYIEGRNHFDIVLSGLTEGRAVEILIEAKNVRSVSTNFKDGANSKEGYNFLNSHSFNCEISETDNYYGASPLLSRDRVLLGDDYTLDVYGLGTELIVSESGDYKIKIYNN